MKTTTRFNKLLFSLSISLTILMFAGSPKVQAQTKPLGIKECYQLAVQKSEPVDRAEQDYIQSRALAQKTLGGTLPKITAQYKEFVQDTPNTAAGATSSFTKRQLPETKVNLSQPLFQGTQEFFSSSANKWNKKTKKFEIEKAKRDLYLEVAKAYLEVVNIELEKSRLGKILSILKSQKEEVARLADLGRTRESAAYSIESQLSTMQAQYQAVLSDAKAAKERLRFLIATDGDFTIKTTLDDIPIGPVDEYLAMYSSNPEIQALSSAEKMNKSYLRLQKGSLVPRADLSANYYPQRSGVSDDIHWDVGVVVSAPLFDLTRIGAIKEAKAELAKSRLTKQETTRQFESNIRTLHEQIQILGKEKNLRSQAVVSGKKSFELEWDDYKKGLTQLSNTLTLERDWFDRLGSLDAVRIEQYQKKLLLLYYAGAAE